MGKWKTQINVKVVDSEGRLLPIHNMKLFVTQTGSDLINTDTDLPPGYNRTYTAQTSTDGIAQFTIPSQSNSVPRSCYVQDTTWNSDPKTIDIRLYNNNVGDYENEIAVVAPNPIEYTVANKQSTGSSQYYYNVRTTVNGTAVGNIAITAGTIHTTTSNFSWSKGLANFTASTSTVIVQAQGTYNGTTYYGNATVKGEQNSTPSTPTDIPLNTGGTLVRYTTRVYTVNVKSKHNSVGISDATVALCRKTTAVVGDENFIFYAPVCDGITNSAGTYTDTLRFATTELNKWPNYYKITKNGYKQEIGKLESISSNSSTTVVYLYEAIDVYGKCYDATTTKPLSGATMAIKYDSADTSQYETVARSDENGYYSATLGLGQPFYRCVFARDGYYHEDNILMSGQTSFWGSMQWDQIFWQALPTDVNKSIMYKEWLIANHGSDFEKLNEDRFQVVPSANIKKIATMATFNNYADKQGVPKTVSFDDGNGITFHVDTDIIANNGWNGKNLTITDSSSGVKYYALSSMKESYFIPLREYAGDYFTVFKNGFTRSGRTSTVAVTSKSPFGTCNSGYTAGFFSGFTNLEQIVMPSSFYGATSFRYFAYGLEYLEYVNISNIQSLPNISANRVDAMGLFFQCTSLRRVEMANTLPYEDLGDIMTMFGQCKSLEYVDLSGLYAINDSVNTYMGMFTNCISLEKIKVDGCDTTTINGIKKYLDSLLYENNYQEPYIYITSHGSGTTIYTVNFIVKHYDMYSSEYNGLTPFEGSCDFRIYEYASSTSTDTSTCKQRRRTHGEPMASIKVLKDTKVTFAIPNMPSGFSYYDDNQGLTEGNPVEKGDWSMVITKNTNVIIKLVEY